MVFSRGGGRGEGGVGIWKGVKRRTEQEQMHMGGLGVGIGGRLRRWCYSWDLFFLVLRESGGLLHLLFLLLHGG